MEPLVLMESLTLSMHCVDVEGLKYFENGEVTFVAGIKHCADVVAAWSIIIEIMFFKINRDAHIRLVIDGGKPMQ